VCDGGLKAICLREFEKRSLLPRTIMVVPNAAPIIVLALKLPWETLAVTTLVTGFGNMLFNTLWETTLQQHIPPASLSRVSGDARGAERAAPAAARRAPARARRAAIRRRLSRGRYQGYQ
jgi:hypothetical protein